MFEAILSENPQNDAAWYYKGLCQMSMGNEADGEVSLKKATELDSANYWYRDRLALAYSVKGKREEAIGEYERLSLQYPKKIDSYYSLTNLYLSQGDLDKAVKALDTIEELSGKTDATVLTKYRIYLQQQKQEEALNELKEYSEEYSSPQVLTMLGDHEMGMSNDSLALAYYEEALFLDSAYSPALLGKAEVYRLTRNYPKYFEQLDAVMTNENVMPRAKTDYMSRVLQHVDIRFIQNNKASLDKSYSLMVENHPKDSIALRTAGIYYYNTGSLDAADKVFKSNMDSYPQAVGVARDYIEFLALTENYESLVNQCDLASEKFTENEDFKRMALLADYNLGNYEKVISRSEERIRMAPKDSAVCLEAYSMIGDMYHEIGESQKAYKAYDKALKINPDYAPVLNNYAYYLSMEGKMLGKAYKMSKKTIEMEPDNVTYLDTFGWILHLQGKDIEAKPFFKHAMLYGGKEDPTILAHYALVLEKLGETDLAKVYKAQAQAKAEEERKNK